MSKQESNDAFTRERRFVDPVEELRSRRKWVRERIHKLEEAQRQHHTNVFDAVILAMNKHNASPRSFRIALTGFNKYFRVTHRNFTPAPDSNIAPASPGLVLSGVVKQPVA